MNSSTIDNQEYMRIDVDQRVLAEVEGCFGDGAKRLCIVGGQCPSPATSEHMPGVNGLTCSGGHRRRPGKHRSIPLPYDGQESRPFFATQGDSDLLAILAKNRTEPEGAVSQLHHFERLRPLKMPGRPAPYGKRR